GGSRRRGTKPATARRTSRWRLGPSCADPSRAWQRHGAQRADWSLALQRMGRRQVWRRTVRRAGRPARISQLGRRSQACRRRRDAEKVSVLFADNGRETHPMKITCAEENGVVKVDVEGRAAHGEIDPMKEPVKAQLGDDVYQKKLIFNLGRTEYVDSAG